jgi:hypothetical protein
MKNDKKIFFSTASVGNLSCRLTFVIGNIKDVKTMIKKVFDDKKFLNRDTLAPFNKISYGFFYKDGYDPIMAIPSIPEDQDELDSLILRCSFVLESFFERKKIALIKDAGKDIPLLLSYYLVRNFLINYKEQFFDKFLNNTYERLNN